MKIVFILIYGTVHAINWNLEFLLYFLLYVEQVNSYKLDQNIFFWEGPQALSVAFEVFFTMDFFRVAKEKLNTSDPVFPCGKVLCTNFSKTPCGRDKRAIELNANR